MSSYFVELDSHPAMSVSEFVDPRTGIVEYTVSGNWLSGCVTIQPRLISEHEPVPTHVFVNSGAASRELLTRRKERRLTVNGIEIQILDVFRPDKEPVEPSLIRGELVRADGSWSQRELPRATFRYALAVMDALIALWMKRDDVVDLLHMATLEAASRRLHGEKARVDQLQQTIVDLDQQIAASQERAGVYASQASEYELIMASMTQPNL